MVPIYFYSEFNRYEKRFGKRKSKSVYSVLMDKGHNEEGRVLAESAVRFGKPLTHAFLIKHYFGGDIEAFNQSRSWPDRYTCEARHYWDGSDIEGQRKRRKLRKRFDEMTLRKWNPKQLRYRRLVLL